MQLEAKQSSDLIKDTGVNILRQEKYGPVSVLLSNRAAQLSIVESVIRFLVLAELK